MSKISLATMIVIGLFLTSMPLSQAGEGAGKSKPVIELMPSDSLISFHIPSIPGMLKTISASDFGKLWSEPDVQLFIKPFWEATAKEYAQLQGGMPFLPDPKDLQSVFNGDIAFSMQAPVAGTEKPGVCAAFKIGDAKIAAKLFAPLLRGGPLTANKVMPLGPPGGPSFVFEKNILMIASTGKALAGLRARLKNPTKKSDVITSGKNWVAAQNLLKTKGLFTFYINAEAGLKTILSTIKKNDPAELLKTKKIFTELGMDSLKSFVLQLSQRKDLLAVDSAISIDQTVPQKGIVAQMLKTEPIPASALKVVPFDSSFCSAGRLNLTQLLAVVRKLIPANDKKEFEAGLAKAKQMLGVDLEKELLPLIGETWISYDVGGVEFMGMMPSTAVAVDIKNGNQVATLLEKTAKTITQFAAAQAGPMSNQINIKSVKVGTHKVHYLSIPFFPISPAWTTTKDRLLITISVSGMRKAIKQLQATTDITSAPGFKIAFERITGKPLALSALPGQFTFANTGSVQSDQASFASIGTFGKFFVDAAKMGIAEKRQWGGRVSPQEQAMLNIANKIDFALFPPDEAIMKFVKPTATIVLAEKGGVVFRGDLSIPSPGAMGAGQGGIYTVPIIAAIAVPNLLRSRMAANESAAVAGCKTFASAQDIYRRTDWDKDGVLEYSQSIKGNIPIKAEKSGKIPEPTDKTRKAFKLLLPNLSSDDYGVRVQATKGLKKLGPKAYKLLVEAGKTAKDAEVRTRCTGLANAIKRSLVTSSSLDTRYGMYQSFQQEGDIALVDHALANAEGGPSDNPTPKAGYCFKLLAGQGPAAPGGRRSYLRPPNGPTTKRNMTMGYSLVAYPAEWDNTGRNTFIINNTGTVYQQDLGKDTKNIVEKMTEYNPTSLWVVAE